MCLSLSTVRLLRYSSVKSNLNRPLKLLIRLLSSLLSRAAIEVASLSKYPFEAITHTLKKLLGSHPRLHGAEFTPANESRGDLHQAWQTPILLRLGTDKIVSPAVKLG